ncbi:histidine kinase 5 isoform X2 [Hevea brasiliensis]|uniref:histidine kinase 5 isoform X2 n=1 Tax=Hevea brasiliensis TaxID=3981 RepID=UPI0025EA92FA|nr:histidine kinase 5 isoform X2 [Hevea brasiliensis]
MDKVDLSESKFNKMENNQIDQIEDMDTEVVPSMWPEDIDSEKPYNVEKPGGDQDMLEEVTIVEEPSIIDFRRLIELTSYTDKGSSQLAYLVKQWEYQQVTAVRLLREELDILSQQRQEVELKKLEILEKFRFEEEGYGGDKRPISILDEVIDIYQDLPRRKKDFITPNKKVEIDAEYDTVAYWKQRAIHLEKLLEASIQREQSLIEKLQESVKNLERQSSPVEELSQILKRADNFLHFILQNAPVVMGHQDKELRYRFIYNHFPSLQGEDILGKTDMEIFTGAGVKESQDFKREVLEKGLPAKREITFETELFGLKTFLIYVEPVFSKSGETIGINYMGMDVTDQVRKREKMAKLREEIAVQKAKETELNKTIHITEETMRAKQMLATMSHEIRSPLSGVVSMAEILSTTNLDREQRQLLNVMISSGDLVLQLINDILDLSKVESGVMKLEATKFHPREVVKHVLQTAAASLQKILILEGRISDDVPIEVIGDVLRIRQILTNLISNAIKFTHEGKVGINLYVVPDPCFGKAEGNHQKSSVGRSTTNVSKEDKCTLASQTNNDQNGSHTPRQNHSLDDEPRTPARNENTMEGDKQEDQLPETVVWLCCDVYDTGIGIPENALPTLFKKYMQVSADHARKYGGTGLGLAICKQLVELMGGRLTVSSRVNCGSTFTFVSPYKVSPMCDSSDDADELSECSREADARPKTSEPKGSSQAQEKSEISSQCTTGNSPQVQTSKLQPKILLVEDNKINVMVTRSMMKQLGHSMDVVNNGVEAVRAVQCNCYDLILMDVCMPVMDGLQATRLIRSFEATGSWDAAIKAGIELCLPSSNSLQDTQGSMPSTKRTPIIAMTANSLSESAEECYANGMDSFISKPVTFQKIKECFEQYFP